MAYRCPSWSSLCDLPSRVARIPEHGSALMVSREKGRLRAFAFRTSNTRAQRGPARREGFQPLERRNLTLSRARSFRNEDGMSTLAWSVRLIVFARRGRAGAATRGRRARRSSACSSWRWEEFHEKALGFPPS
jgi:hypothetical protein